MLRFWLASAVLAMLAATGCTHKPATYRLLARNPGHVVVPPEVLSPDLVSRTFAANLPPGPGPCQLNDDAVRLDFRKNKKIRVTVSRDALLKQPPGWLAEWSIRVESQGC